MSKAIKSLSFFFVFLSVPMQQGVLISLLKSWELNHWSEMVYCAWWYWALCKELVFLHLLVFSSGCRRCMHLRITTDEVVHARFPNVSLQKRGNMIAGFVTQDFCPRRMFCWQTSSCSSWCCGQRGTHTVWWGLRREWASSTVSSDIHPAKPSHKCQVNGWQ